MWKIQEVLTGAFHGKSKSRRTSPEYSARYNATDVLVLVAREGNRAYAPCGMSKGLASTERARKLSEKKSGCDWTPRVVLM